MEKLELRRAPTASLGFVAFGSETGFFEDLLVLVSLEDLELLGVFEAFNGFTVLALLTSVWGTSGSPAALFDRDAAAVVGMFFPFLVVTGGVICPSEARLDRFAGAVTVTSLRAFFTSGSGSVLRPAWLTPRFGRPISSILLSIRVKSVQRFVSCNQKWSVHLFPPCKQAPAFKAVNSVKPRRLPRFIVGSQSR